MSEVGSKKTVLDSELYSQYNWFEKTFSQAVQSAGDEFFNENFSFKLLSVGKNINILSQREEYFVTKIRIDKQHDAFFRCSSDAVRIILDRILGENKKFELSNITELEAKIISSFNDYIFENISKFILQPEHNNQKRKNFDTLNMTFFIKDNQSGNSAKLIISLPDELLKPESIKSLFDKFSISDFKNSKVEVNIKTGTTKFHLKELKSLEKDDIVIFEESDIHSMTLIFKDYRKDFKITPNPGLITPISDNGGHNMSENSLSQDLWDNIQVEMSAEFEKVKVTLGELKNIEQGLVVDLSSIYDNKISLKVENKAIAKGELVIINDRYGVRIDEVFASDKTSSEHVTSTVPEAETQEEDLANEPAIAESGDDEFDYSDFELDDQDI